MFTQQKTAAHSFRPTSRTTTLHPVKSRPVHASVASPAVQLEGVFNALIPELQRAVADEGYRSPTPIQEQSIPFLLQGRDMIGCAQTGTGKTAAFGLPILQHLFQNQKNLAPGKPRVLVLAPTRELAAQIDESIASYSKYMRINHTVIFGGVGQNPQVNALRRGLDILVATPGRLLDLMNQRHVSLDRVEIFVLDEADRMLDMGFLPDIRKVIAKLPARKQTLFFSATMEKAIMGLAGSLVNDPVHVAIAPEKPAVERIVQKLYFVDKNSKPALLKMLMSDQNLKKVIVFTQMKHVANRVVEYLAASGVSAAAIHGNKSQNARTQALNAYKKGKVRVLVATDIAARGIDVDGVTHVINYDLPTEAETYVHRIGRTARAGAEGIALSFCSAPERDYLRSIEKLLRTSVPVDMDQPYHSEEARNATGAAARPLPKMRQGQQRRSSAPKGGGRFARSSSSSTYSREGNRSAGRGRRA
ncbi:MAG: DEAD/DEAH box helicase [Desulfoplanes sp.]|nr:DEAD/DEAH box helicase [Desulfoplanes sp.]